MVVEVEVGDAVEVALEDFTKAGVEIMGVAVVIVIDDGVGVESVAGTEEEKMGVELAMGVDAMVVYAMCVDAMDVVATGVEEVSAGT